MLMCTDPDYGSENEDGYVRVLNKPRSVGGRLVMRHRLVYENKYGPIPNGYELDHLCKNRRCCNPEHLQLITRSDHASKTNLERYKDEIEFGMFMLSVGVDKEDVCNLLGKSRNTINRWIRQINAEIH